MTATYPLLDRVHTPADLRRLARGELRQLATELRGFLLHSVSQTGGHLSSNLGTVELTIALHYVFNTPWDRIVWDVGHQTYPHKILTGRRDRMHTLRQLGGIGGFPRRDESEYDTFGTAHSSPSISAALGMAMAARLKGEDRHAVAVIGDGATHDRVAVAHDHVGEREGQGGGAGDRDAVFAPLVGDPAEAGGSDGECGITPQCDYLMIRRLGRDLKFDDNGHQSLRDERLQLSF